MVATHAIRVGGQTGQRATARPGLLTVIVPVYNEAPTAGLLLRRLLSIPEPPLQVIAVDDGSTDGSRAILEAAARNEPRVLLLAHARNLGKGAAIRTALPHVRGEVVAIQDADLECDPRDLARMFELLESPEVDVVYGSRWLPSCSRTRLWSRCLSSYLASRLLSAVTNLLYSSRLTDEPTAYKMFRTEILRGLSLEASGFDFCPEVTAKVLLSGRRIEEVPISYEPRSYRQGKKVTWRDGLRALWVLVKLRLRVLGAPASVRGPLRVQEGLDASR
ncbi:MAG: glycosyltransferase family 2 protein [Planctomycetes bacterium]|nr:glycosyltransferase family 2 protein [Planctomycetota bacterium]